MKLKINFVTKKPKLSFKNQLIFIKNKSFRIRSFNIVEVLKNEIFKEKKILQVNNNFTNFIFVNCIDINKTSDFENLGSKLFSYLTENKIRNIFLNSNIQKKNSSGANIFLYKVNEPSRYGVAQIKNKTKKTQVYTLLCNKHRFTTSKLTKKIQYPLHQR